VGRNLTRVSDAEFTDASRRTWLAAERTWLTWWRSGVAVGALALAVGRFLPGLTHGERWPFEAVGVGYGVLSVAILLIGATRQRETTSALSQGRWAGLSSPVVSWLTAAGVALSLAATILVAVAI
jgi:uncharacterized membrane protein YidH (DUF202 family)